MLRGAVCVRAAVKQKKRLVIRGQDAAYRRAFYALDALYDKGRAHDERAG